MDPGPRLHPFLFKKVSCPLVERVRSRQLNGCKARGFCVKSEGELLQVGKRSLVRRSGQLKQAGAAIGSALERSTQCPGYADPERQFRGGRSGKRRWQARWGFRACPTFRPLPRQEFRTNIIARAWVHSLSGARLGRSELSLSLAWSFDSSSPCRHGTGFSKHSTHRPGESAAGPMCDRCLSAIVICSLDIA